MQCYRMTYAGITAISFGICAMLISMVAKQFRKE